MPGDVPSPLIVKIVILENKEGKMLKGLPTWHKAKKKREDRLQKEGRPINQRGDEIEKKSKKGKIETLSKKRIPKTITQPPYKKESRKLRPKGIHHPKPSLKHL